MAPSFEKRFEELCKEADEILAAKTQRAALGFEGTYVENSKFINWQVKARHLISTVCSDDSQHFQAFAKHEKPAFVGDTNYGILLRQRAVLLAAKEDYEGGYFTRLRDLIEAKVFENELEQAQELLKAGYLSAAAVVAGVVLETTLRRMCEDKHLTIGKLERMNADLAKSGAYNSLVQKRITSVAAVRNSAAHGRADEFTKGDVDAMLRDVERFVASHTV